MYFRLNMGIFHRYVSLLEGRPMISQARGGDFFVCLKFGRDNGNRYSSSCNMDHFGNFWIFRMCIVCVRAMFFRNQELCRTLGVLVHCIISLRLMPPAFAGLEIASSMARSTTKSSSSNNSTILSIASSMARSTTKSNSNSSNNQQQQ